MLNNDVLRRARYIFDFDDSRMIGVFAEAGETVTREQISDWLKKDDDPAFQKCNDRTLAIFLNGLINALAEHLLSGYPFDATVIFNMRPVQTRLLFPAHHKNPHLCAGRMDRGLQPGRPRTQNYHIIFH